MKKFSVKQIAAQAGFSTATVDRVLHGRSGVHQQTKSRIERAIEELEAQYKLDALKGRTFYVDVVMSSPARFSHLVRDALNRVSVQMASFRVRLRYYLYQEIDIDSLAEVVRETKERGSHGLILKAPDDPRITAVVDQLCDAGIPAVTLVTDLPQSKRLSYIGIDNVSAGETAAFMLKQWLGERQSDVLLVLSSDLFHGEVERAQGFCQFLEHHSNLTITTASEGRGLNVDTKKMVTGILEEQPNIRAVYSVGGGNRAILDAFKEVNRPIDVFIGHDLDEDNRHLLRTKQIEVVIDHNLDDDARAAFFSMLASYGVTPTSSYTTSRINIVTPFNLP